MAGRQPRASGLWILRLTESLCEVSRDPVYTFGGPASTCVALETEKKQTGPAPFVLSKDDTQQAAPWHCLALHPRLQIQGKLDKAHLLPGRHGRGTVTRPCGTQRLLPESCPHSLCNLGCLPPPQESTVSGPGFRSDRALWMSCCCGLCCLPLSLSPQTPKPAPLSECVPHRAPLTLLILPCS